MLESEPRCNNVARLRTPSTSKLNNPGFAGRFEALRVWSKQTGQVLSAEFTVGAGDIGNHTKGV